MQNLIPTNPTSVHNYYVIQCCAVKDLIAIILIWLSIVSTNKQLKSSIETLQTSVRLFYEG